MLKMESLPTQREYFPHSTAKNAVNAGDVGKTMKDVYNRI